MPVGEGRRRSRTEERPAPAEERRARWRGPKAQEACGQHEGTEELNEAHVNQAGINYMTFLDPNAVPARQHMNMKNQSQAKRAPRGFENLC